MTFKKVREQKIYGCRKCRSEGDFQGYEAERAWLNPRTHETFCEKHSDIEKCVRILIQEEV